MHVMLKRSRSASFRRTVRNEAGDELLVVTLAPGETFEIKTDDDLVALGPDVGGALQECRFSDEFRKFVPLKESQLPEAAKILQQWRRQPAETRGERPALPTDPRPEGSDNPVPPEAGDDAPRAKSGKGAKALLGKE